MRDNQDLRGQEEERKSHQARSPQKAEEQGSGGYTTNPMPFMLTWFGIPLLLIIGSVILSNFIRC